ncbi:transcriptional regulator [bacterium]|nr:MAG: transcriptional regulator [bacterium]
MTSAKPKRQTKIYDCPVETTLAVIGGKWKSVILYYLLKRDVMRFSELKREMTKVTQQMLSAQLRELEADGLIHREVYPQVPPKVEYSLTPYGQTLKPIILAMIEWGQLFDEKTKKANEQSSDLESK